MGILFDLNTRIEKTISDKGLDKFRVKGMIGLESGILLGVLSPTTPDDPEKIAKLKAAATKILKTQF